jgi:hypothetical protein
VHTASDDDFCDTLASLHVTRAPGIAVAPGSVHWKAQVGHTNVQVQQPVHRESFRIGYPVRSNNVLVHAQHSVSAVADSRRRPRHRCNLIQGFGQRCDAPEIEVHAALHLPRTSGGISNYACKARYHALAYGGNLELCSAPARIILGEHFPGAHVANDDSPVGWLGCPDTAIRGSALFSSVSVPLLAGVGHRLFPITVDGDPKGAHSSLALGVGA